MKSVLVCAVDGRFPVTAVEWAMLLVYLSLSWFLGIWLATQLTIDGWGLAVFGLVSLLLGLMVRQRPLAPLPLVLGCVGVAALGAARYSLAQPTIDVHHIAYYNEQHNLTVVGVVVDEPDVRDRFVNLRVAVEELQLADGTAVAVSGIVQVQAFRFPVISYGTRLSVKGNLETPSESETFSYKAYLARQGVHSVMRLPQLTVVAEGEGSLFYRAIFSFKQRAQLSIQQMLPSPQADLLIGILLGNDNGMPPALAEDFRATGMTHIIAISGFNIAVLIAILVRFAEPLLGQRGAAVFAVVGIGLYTILVGAEASVVRAAIMGTIYLGTQRWLGRPNFAFASLFAAGWLMTLFNPFTLWDVGFQLSFMATLSLMLYADPLTRWAERQLLRLIPRQRVQQVMGLLSEAVIITLAAQILTLPLMIGYFEQLSLISLLANAVILPAQPAVMSWGGLATLAGVVWLPLGQWLAWVVWLPLTYTILFVRAFAAVPYAAVPFAVGWPVVLLVYAGLTAVTWLAWQAPEQRRHWWTAVRHSLSQRVALGGTLVLALLTVSWGSSQPDGRLRLVFLDVGQGDAIFIQTPSGRQILVDGGMYPSRLKEKLGQQMPFWDKTLDMVVATHPDADHVAGLVDLFTRYDIALLVTNGAEMGESSLFDALLVAAEKQQTPIHRAMAGELIRIEDGVLLEIVHPSERLDSSNRNNNSVSFRLVYGEFTALLTGDVEEAGESEILSRDYPLQAFLFKAGHHGADTSSTAPFLATIRPSVVVVSSGVENRFGHPNENMLQRAAAVGAVVLRTDQLGSIEVSTDGQQMWWQARP